MEELQRAVLVGFLHTSLYEFISLSKSDLDFEAVLSNQLQGQSDINEVEKQPLNNFNTFKVLNT